MTTKQILVRQMSLQAKLKLRKSQRIWFFLLAAGTLISLSLLFGARRHRIHLSQFLAPPYKGPPPDDLWANINNETGAAELIVPNIVHFVLFEDPKISFMHFVCILAALRNQRPEKIYFHGNVAPSGRYWERLMKLEPFTERLEMRRVELPTEISGVKIQPGWRIFHGGDVTRIRVLMEYGGIFLDSDSYVVRSLDYFRRFEMSIGWDENQFLGSQIIVAHKDARFLYHWLHSYDGAYDPKKWYYNAGELPTTSVLYHHPELVHRVKVLFGNDMKFIHMLFSKYWPGWRENYTFHLLARHQYLLKNISSVAYYPVVFDEFNLQHYPITFREMANEVLDYEKQLLGKPLKGPAG
ncbi:unnamed protein product [Bemisia tabaci]|uniref:Glycosyltransferase n=2 Tax=Bemisia tabaci TaxID=7038 RepID=A0A9P0F753_BEMTA|nr:unnamed protein product [Bemisia tabaci]